MRRYRSLRRGYTPRSIRKLERRSKRNVILSIILMGIIAYLLIFWGLPLFINSLSAFKSPSFVSNKEVKEAISPPVLNIPFEATSSSTIQITGFAAPNTKIEIYLDDQLQTHVNTSEQGTFTTEPINLFLGINNIYGKTIGTNGKESLPSKTIKLFYSNDKPVLEISEPADFTQINGGDKKIKVSGKTDPGNYVTINGITVIVNNQGSFTKELSINDGDNSILIIATNSVGNFTQIEKKVVYTP